MQLIALPQFSALQEEVSLVLNRSMDALQSGDEISIPMPEGGYNGKAVVVLTEESADFETDWNGKDPTRFPARIRAGVGALAVAGQLGTYKLVHKGGILTIRRFDVESDKKLPAKVRNPDWTRDELILALRLYLMAGRKQLDDTHPDVVTLSTLLNLLPIHKASARTSGFRNANGVAMKLGNFTRLDPQYTGKGLKGLKGGNQLESIVWEEYAEDLSRLNQVADHIAAVAQSADNKLRFLPDIDEDEEFPEGKILTRLHRYRERDSKATRQKKALVLQNEGALRCEACQFEFRKVYGILGADFAECHHRTPIHSLTPESKTKLSDLAILCANCHRMIHRSRPMVSVDDLRRLIQNLRG